MMYSSDAVKIALSRILLTVPSPYQSSLLDTHTIVRVPVHVPVCFCVYVCIWTPSSLIPPPGNALAFSIPKEDIFPKRAFPGGLTRETFLFQSSLHPAVLRAPAAKREGWRDVRNINRVKGRALVEFSRETFTCYNRFKEKDTTTLPARKTLRE
jgi:hypothetical protein